MNLKNDEGALIQGPFNLKDVRHYDVAKIARRIGFN
jgi:hypothetical protein